MVGVNSVFGVLASHVEDEYQSSCLACVVETPRAHWPYGAGKAYVVARHHKLAAILITVQLVDGSKGW